MQIGSKVLLSVAAAVLLAVGSAQATNYTDVDILNFALNLECLEAEFYSWAAYGEGIYSVDSSLVGNNSALTATSSGGQAVTTAFSAPILGLVTEIAENEIAHVRFLRAALGSAAVPCPALSLSTATFTTAASAAVTAAGSSLNPTGQIYNPYANADAFLLGAYIFEDVGVTAYKGAVQNLQNSTLAAVAAGIMAIEAGHAAVIRDQLYGIATAANPATTGLTIGSSQSNLDFPTAVAGINKLRDTLGGTTASSVEQPLTRTITTVNGVGGGSGPELFAADSNAVAFTRTPTQVLNIVYFSTNTTAGGFLPKGATGNSDVTQITATSTKTCSSGALSMASFSAASVAAVAAAAALLL